MPKGGRVIPEACLARLRAADAKPLAPFDLAKKSSAELVKMLVHRRARRRGLGAALMTAAEAMALDCGRTLLVLDAVTGDAGERLYTRLGWTRVGVIPRYALMPDGRFCSTTFFYRDLG